ncbi:hypothetical protein D3C86_2132110 [compost metagenome]
MWLAFRKRAAQLPLRFRQGHSADPAAIPFAAMRKKIGIRLRLPRGLSEAMLR